MDGSDATTESIANAGVARVTIGNEAAAPFTKAALVICGAWLGAKAIEVAIKTKRVINWKVFMVFSVL